MVTGLIQTGSSNTPNWIPSVQTQATRAQSTERRFSRWLTNKYITAQHVYTPSITQALQEWGEYEFRLALDTSLIFETHCIIRIVVLYRGRAVPLVQMRRVFITMSFPFIVQTVLVTMPMPPEATSKPLLILTDFLHLLENPLVPDDSQIQVAVQWFGSDVAFQNPYRIIPVSASGLVRLRIGQRFSDVQQLKVAQPLNEPLLGHVEDVMFEARDSRPMQLREIETKFGIQYLELTNKHNSCQKIAENLWMEVIQATDVDRQSVTLILPHVIIVQTFFSGSSVAVRSLFGGRLVEDFADHCEMIDDGNGNRIARVARQTGWKVRELCLAAQLKAAPEMCRAASSVFANALKVKDAARLSGSKIRNLPIKTALPFAGRSTMSIRGRRLESGIAIVLST
jgi:hypothetical protein